MYIPKETLLYLYYRGKTNITNILFAKSARAILWYPLTDFCFETVEGIVFLVSFVFAGTISQIFGPK